MKLGPFLEANNTITCWEQGEDGLWSSEVAFPGSYMHQQYSLSEDLIQEPAAATLRQYLSLTRVQTMLMLVQQEFITEAEMTASQTTVPVALQVAISSLPADQQTEVTARWLNFQTAQRNDALISILASIPDPDLTDEQIDALFLEYMTR